MAKMAFFKPLELNKIKIEGKVFCFDFRNESKGIIVLGVGFSSDKFRLFQ